MKNLKLLLVFVSPTAAQVRCTVQQVQKTDGSFELDRCDHLLLFGARLGDMGAAKLASALAINDRLAVLDLWSNGIGPDGAQVCCVP